MTDLEWKLRSLDEVHVPDLWERVMSSEPSRGGPRRRHVATILVALGVGLVGVGMAVAAFEGGRHPSPAASDVVSSSAIVESGVRCTATISATLQPGLPIGMTLTLDNLGSGLVEVSPPVYEGAAFTVAAGGRTVFDSARELALQRHPIILPIELAPGESKSYPGGGPSVRWSGPLTIHPSCLGVALSPLQVDVAVPGPTPTASDALERAIAATGGVLDRCRPTVDGAPVAGELTPPDGSNLEPVEASCWAVVRLEDGFAVVTLAWIAPPSAPPFEPTEYWFDAELPPGPGPSEVGQWIMVVTAGDVQSVDGPAGAATVPRDLEIVAFFFEEGHWTGGYRGSCGGGSISGAGLYFFVPSIDNPC